jgi:hypothetical protein
MRLMDAGAILVSLGTGLLGAGLNSTVDVPFGESRQLRPEAGVAFGDGSAFGGSPLVRGHAYQIRTDQCPLQ